MSWVVSERFGRKLSCCTGNRAIFSSASSFSFSNLGCPNAGKGPIGNPFNQAAAGPLLEDALLRLVGTPLSVPFWTGPASSAMQLLKCGQWIQMLDYQSDYHDGWSHQRSWLLCSFYAFDSWLSLVPSRILKVFSSQYGLPIILRMLLPRSKLLLSQLQAHMMPLFWIAECFDMTHPYGCIKMFERLKRNPSLYSIPALFTVKNRYPPIAESHTFKSWKSIFLSRKRSFMLAMA